MMDFERRKEAPKSLFEMASSKYAKKKRAEDIPEDKEVKLEVDENSVLNDPQDVFKKAKKLHEEIELRIDALLRFHDISEHTFYQYLSNPKNFTDEEWKKLEVERSLNKQKIADLCHQLPSGGEEALQKYLQSAQMMEKNTNTIKGQVSKDTQELPRKKKAIPKHKWLNMH